MMATGILNVLVFGIPLLTTLTVSVIMKSRSGVILSVTLLGVILF
jgi:hypothetical protein